MNEGLVVKYQRRLLRLPTSIPTREVGQFKCVFTFLFERNLPGIGSYYFCGTVGIQYVIMHKFTACLVVQTRIAAIALVIVTVVTTTNAFAAETGKAVITEPVET